MAAPVVLDIGPQDPDATDGFGQVGAGQTAKLLLQAHAELYSPELAALLAQPAIPDSELAIDLEEVERIADPPGEVRGAMLRGDLSHPKSLVVTYIYVGESGRSARGVVAWSKLADSQAEFKRLRERQLLGVSLGESARLDSDDASGSGRQAYSAEEIQPFRDEIERLREEVEELRDPQPFEGFSDAKADDVVKHVRDLNLGDPEQYTEATNLLDYERRHKDRATVVEPVEKALQDADEQRQAAEKAAAESQGS